MAFFVFFRLLGRWLGPLLGGGLLLGLVAGCQSPEPPARSAADYLTTIPDPKTLGETYVSDPDALLAPATILALNAQLDSLDHNGRAHIDVVLANSIGEEVPKTAATALFNKWKIGRKDTDNGLLMLLVLDQRRVEFETGYGLEGDLPDAICYRIQQRHMVPALRDGRLDEAVQQGVAALIRQLRPVVPIRRRQFASSADSMQAYLDSLRSALSEQQEISNVEIEPVSNSLSNNTPPNDDVQKIGILIVAGVALVLYLVLWYGTARGLKARGWLLLVPVGVVVALLVLALGYGVAGTIGQFIALAYGLALGYLHGYFGWQYWRAQRPVLPAQRPAEYQRRQQAHQSLGFTAYLFPVLLAFYWHWYRQRLLQLRQASIACPTCSEPMQQLDADAAKSYLDPGQQTEQAIRAVGYDVWACAQAHHLALGYLNPDSEATACPACHYRTLPKGRLQPVQVATYSADGWGWRVQKCHFCQHEEKERETIPQLASPSSSSSSSSSSSWGSSSSSISGSSSSSSSSSGGSSGGGGAGSSW